MKNKKTIFIIATAAFTVLFAFLAVFVISRKKYSFPLYEDKLNIAVVGDSLFCNEGSGANLAVFLEQETGCEMQNCSIGGTSASRLNSGNELDYYSDRLNFYNISNIMCSGNMSSVNDNVSRLSASFQDAYVKMKFLNATDMNKEDFLIVNYGINDAFVRIPAVSDNPYDENTYAGAMRRGLKRISKKYPNLKIIVNEVTYTALVQEGEDDTYYNDTTAAYRNAYNEELKKIADEIDNVYFFEVSDYFEINEGNYEEYLFDGIHLNEEGKKKYASALAGYIGELK